MAATTPQPPTHRQRRPAHRRQTPPPPQPPQPPPPPRPRPTARTPRPARCRGCTATPGTAAAAGFLSAGPAHARARRDGGGEQRGEKFHAAAARRPRPHPRPRPAPTLRAMRHMAAHHNVVICRPCACRLRESTGGRGRGGSRCARGRCGARRAPPGAPARGGAGARAHLQHGCLRRAARAGDGGAPPCARGGSAPATVSDESGSNGRARGK